jgi:ATP-dependent DNA helicase RecQ
LNRDGILDYVAAEDGNTLTYLQARPTKITFDKKAYLILQAREEYRKEYVQHYEKTTSDCRENLLLAYFDEKRKETCGKCDICRLAKKSNVGNAQLEVFIKKIKELTLNKNLELEGIVTSFGSFEEHQIITIVKWLLDNEYLTKTNNIYTWTQNQE